MTAPSGPDGAGNATARTTHAPASVSPPRRDEGLGFARHAFVVAGVAAVVWAGALWAFVAGFQSRFGAFEYLPLQIVALLGLSLLPAVFMFLAAYALRQGAQLAAETRRARTLADEMVLPVALAADHAGGAADSVRREIERIAASAAAAREELLALREVVGAEAQGLAASASHVERSTRQLAATIGGERTELSNLAQAVQTQSDAVAETFARQARAVTDAADLAEAQLREAEAALAARAADLSLAATDAGAVALRSAAELAEQAERLETTGRGVAGDLARLKDGLASERETLSELAEVLRSDQEDVAARLETGAAQLTEAGAQARAGAAELNGASSAAIETLRGLAATVADEVQALTETARREQATAEAQAQKAVAQLSQAADQHYDAVEARTTQGLARLAEAAGAIEAQAQQTAGQLSQAAEQHFGAMEARTAEGLARISEAAEAAREATAGHMEAAANAAGARLEALSSVAFSVSQQAEQTFESRIAGARDLIQQSSTLVEEAGARSAERIEAALETVRGMLGQLDTLFTAVEARAAQLPPEAESKIEAVRAAVERGVGDLTAAARKAAEETQSIDAMFQERVRRNYEVLNEAVQLIGRVAGGMAPAAAARPARAPEPPPPPKAEARPEAPPPRRSSPPATPPAEPSADDVGLRPKLKLAPTPDDRAVKNVFAGRQANGGAAGKANGVPTKEPLYPPDAADEWTWKDLLSSIEEQPVDDETLDEQLIGEIEALGLDISALLPRARIEEIAVVLHAGDAAAAREVVRRLAPAAVRRLSRRVVTDKVLRAHADRYVRRYEALVSDSARPGRDRNETAALLGSEPGRAFLLLDAAVGDLH